MYIEILSVCSVILYGIGTQLCVSVVVGGAGTAVLSIWCSLVLDTSNLFFHKNNSENHSEIYGTWH